MDQEKIIEEKGLCGLFFRCFFRMMSRKSEGAPLGPLQKIELTTKTSVILHKFRISQKRKILKEIM